VSNVQWIQITSGQSGSGNGTVQYEVEANPNLGSRIGNLVIAGDVYTVAQSGMEACVVGGLGEDQVVHARIDTSLCSELLLALNQTAIDDYGRLFISVRAPEVENWEHYQWARPADKETPPYLVLIKGEDGFFPEAAEYYYFKGLLTSVAKELFFIVGELEGLKGNTIVFESCYLEEGAGSDLDERKLIQGAEVSFY
jgi:hypothetical protein